MVEKPHESVGDTPPAAHAPETASREDATGEADASAREGVHRPLDDTKRFVAPVLRRLP
jgi:hypothetical protein